MTIAEFLQKEVKSKGWLYISNLYFDNGLTMFPFTAKGRICLSPSAEMIFSTSRTDSTNSYVLSRDYVAADDRYVGLYQTITVVSFDMLQHFDTNLFTLEDLNPNDGSKDKFLVPEVYPQSKFDGLTAGEDKLYPGTDTATFITKAQASTLPLYPDLKSQAEYHGLLVDSGKTFYKNQKAFAEAMNKLYGLSDCI